MASVALTDHAASRLAQRDIPPTIVELILDYGAPHRRGGADVYALDKKGRRRLKRELGRQMYHHLSGLLNTYAVLGDDGALITAAYRTRRIRR